MDKDEIKILVELATIADSEGDVKTADSIDNLIRTSANFNIKGGTGGAQSGGAGASARAVAKPRGGRALNVRVPKPGKTNMTPEGNIRIENPHKPGTYIDVPPSLAGMEIGVGPGGGLYYIDEATGRYTSVSARARADARNKQRQQNIDESNTNQLSADSPVTTTQQLGDIGSGNTTTMNANPNVKQKVVVKMPKTKKSKGRKKAKDKAKERIEKETITERDGTPVSDKVIDEVIDSPVPTDIKTRSGFVDWVKRKWPFLIIPIPIIFIWWESLKEEEVDYTDDASVAPVAPTGPDSQLHPSEYEGRQRVRQQVPDSILEAYIRAKVQKGFLTESTPKVNLYRAADAEKGRNFANSLIAFIGKRLGYQGTIEENASMPGITRI